MILAVIPARGGSKGIPRKNIRLMNGKPLIYYSIKNALDCPFIDHVVVSSDDEEILSIAKLYGAIPLDRNSDLAQDAVTLDPVIYDAVLRMESSYEVTYNTVVTLQPTSPLLSSKTLNSAIESFLSDTYDTYISTVNKPHLSWTRQDGKYVPNYAERLNRQLLPPNYLETGAFLITKRSCVTSSSRIGSLVSVYEMPENEAIDIDSYSDWIICEQQLKRKKILLRVDGHRALGMGHIYRCLTIAYNLVGHDILFVSREDCQEGVAKLKSSFMPIKTIRDEQELFSIIEQWKPDIMVNDCLNTEASYIAKLKDMVERIITIEDMGTGADIAHATINALYDGDTKTNHYVGEKYVCLRDEFIIAKPSPYSEEVKNVTVMFGGSDPGNFTERIYNIAKSVHQDYPDISFTFILGGAYDNTSNLIASLPSHNIRVLTDVKRVSDVLSNSDLAFTSQGRTVYELASMGVPAIVMAQNERETLHTFACMENGFLNLGLGKNISDETITKVFKFLTDTPQIRQEMRSLMLSHDLKNGIQQVIRIILQENC